MSPSHKKDNLKENVIKLRRKAINQEGAGYRKIDSLLFFVRKKKIATDI